MANDGYKGIILAGGAGTRLYPVTSIYSKQLVTVYDKPMIYYPLSTLMMADVRDILIIGDANTVPWYQRLFGDGARMGMSISYAIQQAPRGIAEAFLIGADFIGDSSVLFILGDNLFYGDLAFLRRAMKGNEGATVFGYHVSDPERYGVVEFDARGKAISIEEKPAKPRSSFAVPGLYVYGSDVVDVTRSIKPSARGELEITSVNQAYLAAGRLKVQRISRGIAWLDSGTPQALIEASNFIATVEARQGLKIGCLEEIALRRRFVDAEAFSALMSDMPESPYKAYLRSVGDEIANEGHEA